MSFIEHLMREWDPNRDGFISKMEFRQDIRSLVSNAQVKDVDDLFERIDVDHNGEVSHPLGSLAHADVVRELVRHNTSCSMPAVESWT